MTSDRNWPFWALIALLVITHFALHLAVGLGATAPDLLTPAVLLSGRRVRGSVAAGIGFGLGLLQDSLSLDSFGAEALTMTLLGYLGARSRDLFVGDSAVFLLVYLFSGKWLHDALFFLLSGTPDQGGTAVWLLVFAPLAAIYAAVAGVAAMAAYRSVTGER
jgi:rod shape-determining protein MreD